MYSIHLTGHDYLNVGYSHLADKKKNGNKTIVYVVPIFLMFSPNNRNYSVNYPSLKGME